MVQDQTGPWPDKAEKETVDEVGGQGGCPIGQGDMAGQASIPGRLRVWDSTAFRPDHLSGLGRVEGQFKRDAKRSQYGQAGGGAVAHRPIGQAGFGINGLGAIFGMAVQ